MTTITRESMELLLEEIVYATRTTKNEILQYEKVEEILKNNGILEVLEDDQTGGICMKNYKDFKQQFIGDSDIAALVLVGYRKCEGVVPFMLNFGKDASYHAYIVNGEDVNIGKHYNEIIRFNEWMRIYDDCGYTTKFEGKQIIVYRAAEMGCIIQIID